MGALFGTETAGSDNAPHSRTSAGMLLTGGYSPDGPQLAQGEPAPRPSKAILTDEEIATIIFNETESLRGSGVSRARSDLAHTIINADDLWGPRRGGLAGTDPTYLKRPHMDPIKERVMREVQEAVRNARDERREGIDPTRGATNFNMRPAPSELPPERWRGFTLQDQPRGPYTDHLRNPVYVHIWHNPAARRR
jgi:hypothetical protein